MVIGFYADDSTDQPHHRIQSAGAVFGWPADIFEAERLWDKQLHLSGIEYFKASECETLSGEFDPLRRGMSLNSARAFADATRRDFVSVLERIGLAAVAVSLLLNDFKDVISINQKARYYYGSDSTILVYGRLIKSTIELIHQDMPALARIGMAFEFDIYSDYLKAEAAYSSLKRKDSLCASVMGHVGHSDDKVHLPLQMADLIAHEARHKTRQFIDNSDLERPAFKFLSKADTFYFIGAMHKSGMLSELDNYPDPPADGSANEYKWTLD